MTVSAFPRFLSFLLQWLKSKIAAAPGGEDGESGDADDIPDGDVEMFEGQKAENADRQDEDETSEMAVSDPGADSEVKQGRDEPQAAEGVDDEEDHIG